ncbi:uncharacterized protein METZ01_LOCUS151807 [marine metagenome]|uniref:Uncharacterized protein n=1 Tax=marine metagenome TaxID=408172 RepID=A0A382ADB6_9ZZZZ
MAKSIKKSISKATKKTKKTAKSAVKEVKAEVSKVTDTGTSTMRATIEKLSKERNLQAAHVWKQIKDNKSLSEKIKAIINSRNFFALLGKVA